MKFFDPRMRIIMESVQPINREYVRVTGKLVTLTRSSKFGSSKLLRAMGNAILSRAQIILIFNIIRYHPRVRFSCRTTAPPFLPFYERFLRSREF